MFMPFLHTTETLSKGVPLPLGARLARRASSSEPLPAMNTNLPAHTSVTVIQSSPPTLSAGGWVGIILACGVFLAAAVVWIVIHKRNRSMRERSAARRNVLLQGTRTPPGVVRRSPTHKPAAFVEFSFFARSRRGNTPVIDPELVHTRSRPSARVLDIVVPPQHVPRSRLPAPLRLLSRPSLIAPPPTAVQISPPPPSVVPLSPPPPYRPGSRPTSMHANFLDMDTASDIPPVPTLPMASIVSASPDARRSRRWSPLLSVTRPHDVINVRLPAPAAPVYTPTASPSPTRWEKATLF